MARGYDLTGKWFGNLEVIGIDKEEMERRKSSGTCYGIYWKCKCHACGKYRTTTSGKLMKGHTTDCGCKRNHHLITHGLSRTPEYQMWQDMKQKCYNKNNKSYKLYGGNGVTVCDDWLYNFEEFYTWIMLQSNGEHSFIKLKSGGKVFSPETCYIEIQKDLISPNIKYMTGKKFGKLTANQYLYTSILFGKAEHFWSCTCECGKTVVVKERSLLSHYKTSCGCNFDSIKDVTKFKEMTIRLHKILEWMRHRCYNKSSAAYQYYGKRGIKICNEWNYDDEKFIVWAITNGYSLGLTIERKNNDGNYTPDNCKWIPATMQSMNKTKNVYYKVGDEVHYLTEWANILKYQNGITKSYNIRNKLESMGGYEVENPNKKEPQA